MEDDLQFPENMPCIGSDETFRFACGPEQPCFGRCCRQLNLPLTPYDVLRMSQNLGISAADFLRAFTGMKKEQGLPQFHLRMIESPDAPCPFVSPAGCQIYPDRPGACRFYPLGRGARITREGVAERYFMVMEEHCAGHGAGRDWTPGEWFADQELARYNRYNDRYMRLLSLVTASGAPLEPRLGAMANLCLWQMDKFGAFLAEMQVLPQLDLSEADRNAILTDPEKRLDFGFSWLELLIFGQAPGLTPLQKTK